MTTALAYRAGAATAQTRRVRVRVRLEGAVQGVGFRPYVHRLANALAMRGWVANSAEGVVLEAEGGAAEVAAFLERLPAQLPPLARIDRLRCEDLAPCGYSAFDIRHSIAAREHTALVLPDVATCRDCLADITDPADRRFRYPFTNCTNCGPRFSIVRALPYDRANTTMRAFVMCAACRAEYDAPSERRFHAQPTACPDCGPQLSLVDRADTVLAHRDDALRAAAAALRNGEILALKGLGGYQLLVDARNGEAVAELRRRKNRPDKPFALMVPSLADAEALCDIAKLERSLLTAPQAPIVLLRRRFDRPNSAQALAASVAPDNPLLGIMLPYTPLHHLLMGELGFPVIATSGNVADEPMAISDENALARLGGIADKFLTHDRPIACAVDDSVVRVVAGRALMLRRARGYAPSPVGLPRAAPTLLALGGQQKSVAAITLGARAIVGPHIGDLDSAPARQAYHFAIDGLRTVHASEPVAVACDRHPDYYTSAVAARSGRQVVAVQHHLAHIVSCMADNDIEGPVLGVAWDGTGYGDDGTIWGGEFIAVDGTTARRVAHLRPFPLPGGETAIREPRRAALGLLYELFGDAAFEHDALHPLASFSPAERRLLRQMLARNLNTPLTSSVGRLFDAVAALLGLTQRTSFEGQAAMALEFAVGDDTLPEPYPMEVRSHPGEADAPLVLDWRPLVEALLRDLARSAALADMAGAVHGALIEAVVTVASHFDYQDIMLTGGCFQNRRLTEGAVTRLRQAGFMPHWHRHLPPNDGGLAVGQAVWAARLLAEGAA